MYGLRNIPQVRSSGGCAETGFYRNRGAGAVGLGFKLEVWASPDLFQSIRIGNHKNKQQFPISSK